MPRELQLITARAMAREREERYQSAGALADDLQAYLDGRPIAARGHAPLYLAGKWILRHRLLSVAAALLLLAATAGLLYWRSLPAVVTIWTGEEAAEVLVDGQPVGRTEAGKPLQLELPAGQHRLEVKNARSFPHSQPLPLSPGQRREFTVLLRRRTGRLFVSTVPPGATVLLGGQPIVRRTPAFAELERGRYRIEVRLAGYRTVERKVQIGSGGALSAVDLALERADAGELAISSDLERLTLEIFPDGSDRPLGRHSVPAREGQLPALRAGRYRLRCSKSGYLPLERTVAIEHGRRLALHVNLAPIHAWRRDLARPIASSLLVGDLDRSGRPNLVGFQLHGPWFCLERTADTAGWQVLWQAPQQYWRNTGDDALLADLDGDGSLDLLVPLTDGRGRTLVAISGVNGEMLWQRPKDGAWVAATADLDGDGRVEVVAGGVREVLVLEGRTGALRHKLPIGGSAGPPALVDTDGDGRREVVLPASDGRVYLFDPRSKRTIAAHALGVAAGVALAAGDLDGDGRLDLVCALADGGLGAFDALSGRRHWRASTGALRGAPLLAATTRGSRALSVVALGLDGTLHVLDGKSGRPRWPAVRLGERASPPALGDWNGDGAADIALVTQAGRVIVIDGAQGREIWSHELEAAVPGSPALADLDGNGVSEIYLATSDGRLYGLQPRLDLLWWRQRRTPILGQALVGPPGRPREVVLLDAGGELVWYELRWGQQVRALRVPAARELLAARGVLFLAGARHVEARRAAGGALLWRQPFDSVRQLGTGTDDLDGDGAPELIVLTAGPNRSAAVVALDAATGRRKWVRSLPGADRWTVPPTSGDLHGDGSRSVLAVADRGALFALRGRDGALLWQVEGLNPKRPSPYLGAPPAVADADGDGQPDVILPSGFTLRLLRGRDGRPLPGDGLTLPAWSRGQPQRIRRPDGRELLIQRTERSVTALALPGLARVWDHRRSDASQPEWRAPHLVDLTGDRVPDVLFSTADGEVLLLDGDDGSVLWRWRGGERATAPLLAAGRRVLLPLANRRLELLAVRPGATAPYWPGPQPGAGSHHNLELLQPGLSREVALSRLLAVLPRDPNATSYHAIGAALARYRQAGGADAWLRYGEAVQRGYTSGRSQVLPLLGRVLEQAPDNWRIRLYRAGLLLGAGQVEQATADLERILTHRGSRTWWAYQLRGIARLRSGRPQDAVLDFSEAATYPDALPLTVLAWRSRAFVAMKDWPRALADLDRVLMLHPAHVASFLLRAAVHEQLGRHQAALDDYAAAGRIGVPRAQVERIRQAIARLKKRLGAQ